MGETERGPVEFLQGNYNVMDAPIVFSMPGKYNHPILEDFILFVTLKLI